MNPIDRLWEHLKANLKWSSFKTLEQKNKLETIPRMLQYGLIVEAIAKLLDLPLEVVQQEAQKYQS